MAQSSGSEPSEDLETPTRSPPWNDPGSGSVTTWILYAAWAALAGVVGLVVVSSLSKTRPVPGDPLVTAPGVPVGAAPRVAVPFVPIPHRAAIEAGRDLAFRAAPETVEQALRLAGALGLGDAVLVLDRGARVVRISDCSSCRARGRERRSRFRRGEPDDACGFEEGFLAAAFECALGREARVVERRCGAGRDAVCEFVVVA